MTTVLQGATSPEALRIVLTPGNSGLDMRSIVSCELGVTRPDRTTTTWAAVLTGVSQFEATARHVFASDEVALPGSYVIEPRIFAPGSRRCEVFKLHVVPYPTP